MDGWISKAYKQKNLLKRCLLLIKAWCRYEAQMYGQGPVLGARDGALTTVALNVMVVSLFTSHCHAEFPIASPTFKK